MTTICRTCASLKMVAEGKAGVLGQALVDFTTHGAFPEEDVSSLKLSPEELPPAIQALAEAKSSLEVCFFCPVSFLLHYVS